MSCVELHSAHISVFTADLILELLFHCHYVVPLKNGDVGRRKKRERQKKRETKPQESEIPLKVNKALAEELFISFCKCSPLFLGAKCRSSVEGWLSAVSLEEEDGKKITRPLGKDTGQWKLSQA